jgi:hypothetical protein
MDPLPREMSELGVKSEFDTITEDVTLPLPSSSNARPEPPRNKDLTPAITEKLFNKRMVRLVSNTDKATTTVFRLIETLKSQFEFGSYEWRTLALIEKNVKIMRNDTVSLKTGLAHFNTILMRGKDASKSATIPIDTPWSLRTQTLNNKDTDWYNVQAEFNAYWAKHMIERPEDEEEQLDDDELIDQLCKQKASSFFLGRGSNKVPPCLLNSNHLITKTGSRGQPDVIAVGGGDPDTLPFRYHTVIASMCRDLNDGLEIADLPESASGAMVPDTAETVTGDQKMFPINDPPVY